MQVNCPSYDCADWQAYDYSGCEKHLGGIRHLVLLKCGTEIVDPTDGVEILAAITAGNAVLIRDVQVGIDAPSPVKVDSLVAGVPQITVTYDRTATLVDRKVSPENIAFYNSVNSSSGFTVGGAILYDEGADRIRVIEEPITLDGGNPVPNNDGELQRFEYTLNWRALGDPVAYATAPTGVWD